MDIFNCGLLELKSLVTSKFSPLWSAEEKSLRLKVKQPEICITQYARPFSAVAIDGLFKLDALEKCQKELLDLQFEPRKNDLYNFNTTSKGLDAQLKGTASTYLHKLKEALYSPEFTELIAAWTGVDLMPNKIDMAGQLYNQHGYLGCHDDDIREQEGGIGRRIAFIIYLVKPSHSLADLSKRVGGNLELIGCDERNQPRFKAKTKIAPVFGRMAFFEVTPTSYHQVSEILAPDFQRITITGWLYGPVCKEYKKVPCLAQVNNSSNWMRSHIGSLPVDISSVVNAEYISKQAQRRIADIFAEESSIALQDFIKPEIYSAAVAEMSKMSADVRVGPINRRNYACFPLENLPRNLFLIYSCLSSATFYNYLCDITGLPVVASSAKSCIRQFLPGNYTFLYDDEDQTQSAFGMLHASLMLAPADSSKHSLWHSKWGGASTYVAREDGTALMRLYPIQNTLTLVYILPETAHFVEYVNHGCSLKFPNGKLAGRSEVWQEYLVEHIDTSDGDESA